jgi:hypothetical protein
MNSCLGGVALLLVFGACGGGERGQPAAPPTSPPVTSFAVVASSLVFTPASPTRDVAVEAANSRVDGLVLRLASVENAERQGFVLAVDITTQAGTRIRLDRVAPYPADQTARFELRLPSAAVRALDGGPFDVVVALLPADRELPLDPEIRVVADLLLVREKT